MSQPDSHKAYLRANHTVSKTRQVVMLYDGMIRFMQQAVEAIEKKDYETRYHRLTRASDIIAGLQSCLDFDGGGSSARILYDFYSAIDLRIFTIHRSNDVKECEAVIAQLKEMREVWHTIDRAGETSNQAHPEKSAVSAISGDTVIVSA